MLLKLFLSILTFTDYFEGMIVYSFMIPAIRFYSRTYFSLFSIFCYVLSLTLFLPLISTITLSFIATISKHVSMFRSSTPNFSISLCLSIYTIPFPSNTSTTSKSPSKLIHRIYAWPTS